MLFGAGPDFIALLNTFPPDSSERRLWSGKAPPRAPHLLGLWMEECGRRQALCSTPFSLPALHLSLPYPSHAQLIQSAYGGEIWASAVTPYTQRCNIKPDSKR